MGDTPVPRTLYIHDDLTGDVRGRYGPGSAAVALAEELLALARRDVRRVVMLTLPEQIDALSARGPHEPFALALAIGPAGERVARQVHARTGWFPTIRQVDLTREEDARGGYAVVSLGGVPLADQLVQGQTGHLREPPGGRNRLGSEPDWLSLLGWLAFHRSWTCRSP